MKTTQTLISDIPYFRNKDYTAFPMDLHLAYNELGLGATERVFYIGFISHFGTEATVSYPELATVMGFAESTVKKVIRNLQEKGLLEVNSRLGRSVKNQYKIKYLYYGKVDNAVGL